MLSSPTLKGKLRALVETAISEANARGNSLQDVRGCAGFDDEKDRLLAAPRAFQDALDAAVEIEVIARRLGPARDVVLQFLFQVFEGMSELAFQEKVFEETWRAFATEVVEPNWTYQGAANLTCLRGDIARTALHESVIIIPRSTDALLRERVSEPIVERLTEDRNYRIGVSAFVLIVTYVVAKSPANIRLWDVGPVNMNASRAIAALRLLQSGDIGIGEMWLSRPARFNMGLSGLLSSGMSIPNMGLPYTMEPNTATRFAAVYNDLVMLERIGYKHAPGNLDLGLHAFTATYDRWPSRADSQFIDAITSLEAVLGMANEITFRLSFRIASLLARDDEQRSKLFADFKEFYDTRSTLVHGSNLKAKHKAALARVDEVRALARTVLRTFVGFASAPEQHQQYDRSFFEGRLDTCLISSKEREALRAALGFSGHGGAEG